MLRRPGLRLANVVRGRPVASTVAALFVGIVVAGTAIAATTGSSGGPITAVKFVRADTHFATSSSTYSDVPGASTTITVPSGQRAVILARFSGTSDCPTNPGEIGHCFARILIGGVEGAPGTGDFGYFDSSQSNVLVGTSHYIERSRAGFGGLPAGSYEVKVQARAGNATFDLDGWHLTVERSQVG